MVFREKIDGLQDHIEELLEEEKVERQIQKAEMEGNIIQHHVRSYVFLKLSCFSSMLS